jgi:hypothetical protein
MSDLDLIESPESVFVTAPRQWKGLPLSVYGDGNKMLLAMAASNEDPFRLITYIALYLLTHDRIAMMRATRDRDAFRASVLDWVDGLHLTEEENDAAEALVLEIFKESQIGKVTPIPTGGGSEGNG